jgi:ferredoxin-NADP reductase
MRLTVTRAEPLADGVRLIRLQDRADAPLPRFDAGAHIELGLEVDGQSLLRKYSLVSETRALDHYEIAVKRNDSGRGGSRFLHDVLAVGDTMEVSTPVHAFGIAPAASHHVLIAGGIGITPMLGMASALKQRGASYELHYSARHDREMAFRDRLLDEGHDQLFLYATRQGESPRRIDVQGLLQPRSRDEGVHFHVCGPAKLIDDVRLAAVAHGVASSRIHFESFGPAWSATDTKVRLALTESGLELEASPGTTLLDAVEAAGAWIPSDCRRGECGACIVSYSGGIPIHRDNCLTPQQRTHSMCLCVSWAEPGDTLALRV